MENRRSPHRPVARSARLVVRDMDEETLIYDPETHQAMCLNAFSARVWRQCDGTQTARDIARALGLDGADEPVIQATLEKLADAKLLEPSFITRANDAQVATRREMLKRAALLAVVATIVVPSPVMAGSVGFNGPCQSDFDCVPGLVCSNGKCKNSH
jgi:glutamate synthase domain-containing protein 2